MLYSREGLAVPFEFPSLLCYLEAVGMTGAREDWAVLPVF